MRFVVICAPRTGSSHLVNRLSGHPDLFTNGNIFDARRERRLYVFWPERDLSDTTRADLLSLRERDPWGFLEHVLSRNYDKKSVGFKIFDGENNAVLSRIIEDVSIRKVVLYRRNVLAGFSSMLIAKETRKYGLKEGATSEQAPKVLFRASEFVRFHDQYTAFYRRTLGAVASARQSCFVINYEDVNEPHIFANLLGFLGADPNASITKELQHKIHVKQNSPDIVRRFQNTRAVTRFLEEYNLLHWQYEGELGLFPLASQSAEFAAQGKSDQP